MPFGRLFSPIIPGSNNDHLVIPPRFFPTLPGLPVTPPSIWNAPPIGLIPPQPAPDYIPDPDGIGWIRNPDTVQPEPVPDLPPIETLPPIGENGLPPRWIMERLPDGRWIWVPNPNHPDVINPPPLETLPPEPLVPPPTPWNQPPDRNVPPDRRIEVPYPEPGREPTHDLHGRPVPGRPPGSFIGDLIRIPSRAGNIIVIRDACNKWKKEELDKIAKFRKRDWKPTPRDLSDALAAGGNVLKDCPQVKPALASLFNADRYLKECENMLDRLEDRINKYDCNSLNWNEAPWLEQEAQLWANLTTAYQNAIDARTTAYNALIDELAKCKKFKKEIAT